MTRLFVNLNEIALLKNRRQDGGPSLTEAAKSILQAGAQGVAVRYYPDERDVRAADIADLGTFLADFNAPFPSFMMKDGETGDRSLTIEGVPDARFCALATENKCDVVTLADGQWSRETVTVFQEAGRQVSILIDPDPAQVDPAASARANAVTFRTQGMTDTKLCVRAAERAQALGLRIYAGGGLTLDNLAAFIAAMPACDGVYIGHAMTVDALKMGWHGAVSAYLAAISYGKKTAGIRD